MHLILDGIQLLCKETEKKKSMIFFFLFIVPFNILAVCQNFRGTYCLHHQVCSEKSWEVGVHYMDRSWIRLWGLVKHSSDLRKGEGALKGE
jgi:hypothetical protein